MTEFHLRWRDRDLGQVHDLVADQPGMSAKFEPAPGLDSTFRDLFNFLIDEENSSTEPPFPPDLLHEENWWLVDTAGKNWGISVPAVYLADDTMAWRWRGQFPDHTSH